MIKPKVVATLGNFSTKLLLEKNVSISKVHGQKFTGDHFYIIPIYHPAAALYTPKTLEALRKDFLTLQNILQTDFEPPPSKPEQMELF